MQGKKAMFLDSTESKTDFIKWFSELNKNSGSVAGGKGANLAEIYNLKVPVPPGFVITAQAYDYFIKNARLNEKIKNLLDKISYEDTKQLDQVTGEIREIIENANFPENMKEEILEAYETLSVGSQESKNKEADELIEKSKELPFVAVRSSATTEDLAEASFAGQQETFLNVRGSEDLLKHIKMCFASLFTSRATYYRNKKGFKHEQASLAVVIQKMIDSDKSGVIFSKDPSTKRDVVIIEAVWGLGEGIVSGQITPDRYVVSQNKEEGFELQEKVIAKKKIAIIRGSNEGKETIKLKEEKSTQQVLKEYEIRQLADLAMKLENHYKKPQDIEFAIAGENVYIVQTRPITTLEKRAGADSGKELKGEVMLTGLAASPGIGFGKVKIIDSMADLEKIKSGDVLVTKMTNPDMVVTMQKSAAIVTDEGGLTSHASIVSREMGIPAVVGTEEGTTRLKEGEIVTVDGFTGKVYKGKVSEVIQKEIKPVTAKTKTEIKVMVDLPSFASRASKTELKAVGLARIEGIIAESGKHPMYFLEKNKIKDYEEIIFRGLNEISKYFDEIWVRTSDIRSDEFQNLEGSPKRVEANPMLGMHGIRFSIKNPKILEAELKAMKRVSKQGKKIGIMAPQIISLEELKTLKKLLEDLDFSEAKVGVMIETPAAVQLIKDLCDEGINFISFGTNDLTQYTLAIDRGNELVQGLYNEMHPSVLRQIAYVVKICKGYGVETSICGQAGSKHEMVKFLVEQGIDSISVNADVASEIADYVAELEQSSKKNTKTRSREIKEDAEENIKINKNKSKNKNENREKEQEPREMHKNIIQMAAVASLFEPYELPAINGSEFLKEIQEGIEESIEKAEVEQEFIYSIANQISKSEQEQSQTQNQTEVNQTNVKEAEASNEDEILDIF